MNPYQAYQETSGVEWTRIDMLLALFNRAVERLEAAGAALRAGDELTAVSLLSRAQVFVCELAAGVDPNADGSANMLRLYEFVVHAISRRDTDQVKAALQVLRTVREGFRSIRDEAASLEHSGALPSLNATAFVQAMA